MAVPRRILPAIALAQLAGGSLWFATNGVMDELQRDWGLADSALGTLTAAVQLGFVAGTLVFALLTIADRFSPRRVFLACALSADAAPRELVGSVLTIINCIGFALTAVLIPAFAQAAATWPLERVLPFLAIGPLAGLAAMRPLLR